MAAALAKAKDPTNPEIDLSAYGIHRVLKRGFDLNSFMPSDIQPCSFKKTAGDSSIQEVTFSPGSTAPRTYRIVKELGKGTYGTTYTARGEDGIEYAIKWLHNGLNTVPKFLAFVRECIIQIMIVLYSIDDTFGPFAPVFYEIGFDPVTQNGFIRTQQMAGRLDNLINSRSAENNEQSVPVMLSQTSYMLEHLKKAFEFNHRDLKADNVMYFIKNANRNYCLIDFGMACLTWNGLKISGSYWFDATYSCFKIDRDLGQFMFYLLRYHSGAMSPKLRGWLDQMLRVRIAGRSECIMSKNCPGIPSTGGWSDSYEFVDYPLVDIVYAHIDRVRTEVAAFLRGKPFGSSIPAVAAEVIRALPAAIAAAAPAPAPAPAVLAAAPSADAAAAAGRLVGAILAARAAPPIKARRRTRKNIEAAKEEARKAKAAKIAAKAAAIEEAKAAKAAAKAAKENAKAAAKAEALAKKLAAKVAKGAAPKVAEVREVIEAAAEGAGKAPSKANVAEAAAAVVDALKPPTKVSAPLRDAGAEPRVICPEGTRYNEKTRKCVKARKPPQSLRDKPCPPGKVRNPATRRCVKEGGAAARPLPPVPAGAVIVVPKPVVPKACPEGKIFNPLTRRCVKAGGARGKKLLVAGAAAFAAAASTESE
jgi:hypothetical protein